MHHDCVEIATGRNLRQHFDSLLVAPRARSGPTGDAFSARPSRLKVYVRDADAIDAAHRAGALATHLDPTVARVLLHAAICRRELRVEIDGVLKSRRAPHPFTYRSIAMGLISLLWGIVSICWMVLAFIPLARLGQLVPHPLRVDRRVIAASASRLTAPGNRDARRRVLC
jgi:hypothetical protein